MDGETKRRIGENEVLFRDVNEIIERGRWPEEHHPVAFRCECARLGCNRMIDMLIPEYESVRRHPRRFVIAPQHLVADAETVVGSRGDYLVVEKRGLAGEIAEDADPRR